jgi:hypothetical protein
MQKKITKEEGESKSPDNEQKKRTDLGAARPRAPTPPKKNKEKKTNGLHCSCADTSPSQKFQTLELAASFRKLNFPNKPIVT